MLLRLKRWFAPPIFPEDETKTRHASLLNIGLILAVAHALIILIGIWLGGKTPPAVTVAMIVTLGVCCLLLYGLHQRRVELAGAGLLICGVISITVIIVGLGTVQTPITAYYLGVVIGAGLLFDLRGILAATALSSLIVLGLIVAENAGQLPPHGYAVTVTHWIVYTALFGFTGLLTYTSLRSERQALRRADREIAERQQMEAALRESEQRYRAIFDGVRDAIIVEAADGRILDVNASACEMYGDTRENLLRKPVAALVAPDQVIVTADHAGQPDLIGLPHETVNVRANGDRFPTEINCCVTNIHGQQVLLVVARDITERKRAEEALRWSEELYHSLVETLPLSVFRKDATGRFMFANTLYCRTQSRSLAEISGKTDYDLHPRELADKYRADDQRCMATGEVLKIVEEHQPLDGPKTYVEVVKTPLSDAAGRVIGIQGAFWDVTDQMRVAEALREMNAALEQRVAERTRALTEANVRLAELDHLKDEFIGRISHELRTPLTNIKIYLELLEHGKPEKRGQYMRTLCVEADRLHRQIDDLLEVSHLQITGTEPQLAPVDMNQLVQDLITDRTAKAQVRHLALVAALVSDPPVVITDRALAWQVLSRLIANALNYTPRGGAITLSTRRDREADQAWLRIEVRDTGPGISEQDLPYIFEPFYRGQAASNYKTPGTGVGLSIAQQIVESLKGRITVESRPGQGAMFIVWLPADGGNNSITG